MEILDSIYEWVWGIPLLALTIGVGFFYTLALRGIQFRYFFEGLRLVLRNEKEHSIGDVSHFQSLMTALAAAVGIGNIAGVATAFMSGGIGALFWMWITAIAGMAVKYAEACLAVKYRITDARGEMAGGPMYFIDRGLTPYGVKWKWLAYLFALFGSFAALGGGNMLQANSVACVVERACTIAPQWTAIFLAVITGLAILGGIKSIGKVASILVPFMASVYIGGCFVVMVLFYAEIPQALLSIVEHAFTGQAAFGGFLGASVATSIRVGVSRGVMTSEAGLGTASIASAAARTNSPVTQGLVSMTGSFLATVVMCTATALVLSITGVVGQSSGGRVLNGAALTMHAFDIAFSYGGWIVSTGLVLFAFTTIIGWAYYGEKCIEYLVGEKYIVPYRFLFTLFVYIGAVLELEVVWKLSDIFNGLMAFPNLVGICALSPVVIRETKVYLSQTDGAFIKSPGV